MFVTVKKTNILVKGSNISLFLKIYLLVTLSETGTFCYVLCGFRISVGDICRHLKH